MEEGWTTAAFQGLRDNLNYARDLVSGGNLLEKLGTRKFDVGDLYRAAWVQAVSALDHWVHRELYDRALGFALNVDQPRPPRFFDLQIPMQMFEDVHHHGSVTLQEAFATHLRSHFGHQSFQAPDKIRQALGHVSTEPLWPSVGKVLAANGNGDLKSQAEAVECLRNIVNRRNRIAHETDRDPEDGTTRLSISADEVMQTIEHVELIAAAIATVLGAPPVMPVQPVHDVESENGAIGLTPKQELYRQFWTEFKPVVERHGWTKSNPPAQNWWNMPAGVTGAVWGLSYAMFGCRSELYFEHVDPATNLARWRVLHERRDEIMAGFGGELFFDELPKNKGCRIETRLNGPKITDRAGWPQVHRWLEDTQLRLRAAVDAVGGVPTVVAPPDSTDV
ncbi:DUF4268 domain-containing protein [Actinophytocola glycyrrhizae]|uniref:DUF4268 domain-containing protein n=1 Tax=Actinophytocola glycyrrhizae TaxID=2044873 RepID=A0ABV9SEX7_9PSEU